MEMSNCITDDKTTCSDDNMGVKSACILFNDAPFFHVLLSLRSMVKRKGSCLCQGCRRQCRRRHPGCHTFGFRLITFEGMHQLHLKFTER